MDELKIGLDLTKNRFIIDKKYIKLIPFVPKTAILEKTPRPKKYQKIKINYLRTEQVYNWEGFLEDFEKIKIFVQSNDRIGIRCNGKSGLESFIEIFMINPALAVIKERTFNLED